MMMAMVTMFLLAILAGELVYQSGVYSSVVFRHRDSLRATLLARTGLRLALLQLRATKKARAKAESLGLGKNSAIVDKIWQTQLVLPPPDIPGLSPMDTEALGEFRKSLGLEGTVSISIFGESGRMSLNELVWPMINANSTGGASKGGDEIDPNDPRKTKQPGTGSATATPEQIAEQKKKSRAAFSEVFENLFEKKRQDDDAFREKYATLRGDFIVGNLLAWMDPETKEDGEARDKYDYYRSLEPTPYALKDAPIASDSEFHMIKGFDDTISKIVNENFTIRSAASLDVNKAPILLIQSLLPELRPDAVESIDKRRKDDSLGGPFKDAKDFWAFVNTLGSYDELEKKFSERGLKILDSDTSYRAVISAQSGMASKTWLADIGPLPPKVDQTPQAPAQAAAANPPPQNTSTSTSTSTSTKTETSDSDSLSIVYLKAE